MSAAWVAAGVRARAMMRRRLGREGTATLAASPSLEVAVSALTRTPYGHDVRPGDDLARAQRAVVETLVWNSRVLAGWVPREGVTMLRVLLGALEIADVEDHTQRLAGGSPPPPYQLGGLATAWPRLVRTTGPAELRRVLAASPWGEPGGESPREIGLTMRATLADRLMAAVPDAASWAAGATALLFARELFVEQRDLPPRAALAAARVFGPAALAARTLPQLRAALPAVASWTLADVDEPDQLWLAESSWWDRVERDAGGLTRRAVTTPSVVVGAVALLAVDAWRVRAALESAARGGSANLDEAIRSAVA